MLMVMIFIIAFIASISFSLGVGFFGLEHNKSQQTPSIVLIF
jgi:hypothetical protein